MKVNGVKYSYNVGDYVMSYAHKGRGRYGRTTWSLGIYGTILKKTLYVIKAKDGEEYPLEERAGVTQPWS